MTLTTLALFAIALFLTAIAPGAIVIAIMARVGAKGWRSVMPFVVAIWIGELIWLSAALGGLALLAATFQQVFELLKYAGVAYLLWLAWRTWKAPPAITSSADLPKRDSAFGMFIAGMVLALASPEIMIFHLALLPSLIDMQTIGLGTWALLLLVTFIIIAVTDIFWITMAMLGRRFMTTPKAAKTMNQVSACALAGAATVIATR